MTSNKQLMDAMRFSVTQEMIDALPEDQRAIYQRVLDSQNDRAELIDNRMAAGDYNGALVLLGSEERAPALIRAAECLEPSEAYKLVKDWWSITEAWSGDSELREGMHRMLKRVAPVCVYGDPVRSVPSGIVTIFRGNNGETPEGMGSWTLDYDVAVKFAAGTKSPRGMFLGIYDEDGIPTIWRAYVPAGRILGYFDDRWEQEVVVDAADLLDVTMVAQA